MINLIKKPARFGLRALRVAYGLTHRAFFFTRRELLREGFDTVRLEYSLMGRTCTRENVEGQKVTRNVPGFYTDTPDEKRIPEAPGGILALLRKRDDR